jgi:dTDP-glucose 4,6-dehydratase
MDSEESNLRRIVVTGGAGFIGSHFVKLLLRDYDCQVVNLDALRYSGNLANLCDVQDDPRYTFVQGDIGNIEQVRAAIEGADAIVNFAAETHVDRAILDPGEFIQTNMHGVYVLAEAAKEVGVKRFVQISTDEVYGSIDEGAFTETDQLTPRNPYSASKAGGELLARSYYITFGLPVIVTRGSNTYGPNQYPEKMIPLFVTNALDHQSVPVYGDGRNVRDWLFVEDHCRAIDMVLRRGMPGEVYNISGRYEMPNIEVTRRILGLLGRPDSLIEYVPDRPGHDFRYSIDSTKIEQLGWKRTVEFDDGLAATVRWYADNRTWWAKIKSGEFREYYRKQYSALGRSDNP